MKTRWNLADLIDLEYLLGRDETLRKSEGEQAPAERDRRIYLEEIAPELEGNERPRPRDLIRLWLEARRNAPRDQGGEPELLPGAVWQGVTSLLSRLALVFGALSGLGLAGAFLVYTGNAPLNVSAFLGLFVVLQLGMLLLQCLVFVFGGRWRGPARPSAVQALVMRLATACADWAYARARRGLTAEKRLGFAALLGRLRARREQAGLFLWPVFFLLQQVGIGFNLGVIGLTLAKVVFSDMAFGWQSSLQVSAEQIARAARLAALPWSWLLPEGLGYPSPDQVAGTQIVLKEGSYHLATRDLVSWWPFLCMAVLVYGLLPRLVMLAVAFARYRRRLDRLELRGPETRRLVQRMTVSQVHVQGTPADASRDRRPSVSTGEAETALKTGPPRPISAAHETPPEATGPGQAREETTFAPSGRLILAPAEVLPLLDGPTLAAAVARANGPGQAQVRELPFSSADETRMLDNIRTEQAAGRFDEICLVQEAWMPPLQETLHLLARLRDAAGPAAPITVFLTGKPGPDGRPGPPQPEHLDIWAARLAAAADPDLDTRPLVEAP